MNETELLFTEILGCERTELYIDKSRRLNVIEARMISSALKRRLNGEPVEYIIGRCEFMGLSFNVTKDVLIPRPDTEIVVETALKLLSKYTAPEILDLCTGSANIAVSLAKYLAGASVTAADISARALAIAEANAASNGVGQKIRFVQSDLFAGLDKNIYRSFDLIVSNPPYVRTECLRSLCPEIQHEPAVALDGGKDGLDFYRRIISQSRDYLKEGGFLLFEIGFDQLQQVKDIFLQHQNFEVKGSVRDYNDIERAVIAQFHGK